MIPPISDKVDWTLFLRAMADAIDAMSTPAGRDEWLRDIGARVAAIRPLRHVANLESLAMEVNDFLRAQGWGEARFDLQEADRSLLITHSGLPRLGAAGEPPGTWLTAMLEGLYTTWLGHLPGADKSLVARRLRASPDATLLRYALQTK
jgi:hypothetical protein